MSSVVVTQPIGSWSAPRATADVFQPGILTITSVPSMDEWREFEPHQWRSCTVYDESGWPLFHFNNDAYQEREHSHELVEAGSHRTISR